jgi:NAD(P)-dependent dehydrogenase (short-subunit alcohol dehydrogenase family)
LRRGRQAVLSTDSVAEAAGAERIVQSAVDAFGRIDAVVNNAGILRDAIFHKLSVADWEAVIQVHLHGSFYMSRAAAGFFKEQQSGALVHMTSTSGLIGNLGQANYSAAKLGIVALSKSIALDMARFNVRSNCISPFAWSRMTSSVPTDTPEKAARVERNKQMTPEKIAPVAVYLASDAAQHVNAQVFAVRNNEIFLMSQPRPLRSVHSGEGWTPQSVAEHAMPALRGSFVGLERSSDVFAGTRYEQRPRHASGRLELPDGARQRGRGRRLQRPAPHRRATHRLDAPWWLSGAIYPVNPTRAEVQGLPAFASVEALPHTPQAAIVAVPAPQVLETVQALGARGVRAAVVFSSGFAEVAGAGAALQVQVAAAARCHGMRLLGPNCLGLFNAAIGWYPTFTSAFEGGWPLPGRIGVVSQSGAFGSHLITLARARGIGTPQCVTTGNQADVTVERSSTGMSTTPRWT